MKLWIAMAAALVLFTSCENMGMKDNKEKKSGQEESKTIKMEKKEETTKSSGD